MIQFAINKAYFLQALHTTRRAISSKMLSQFYQRLKSKLPVTVSI